MMVVWAWLCIDADDDDDDDDDDVMMRYDSDGDDGDDDANRAVSGLDSGLEPAWTGDGKEASSQACKYSPQTFHARHITRPTRQGNNAELARYLPVYIYLHSIYIYLLHHAV